MLDHMAKLRRCCVRDFAVAVMHELRRAVSLACASMTYSVDCEGSPKESKNRG